MDFYKSTIKSIKKPLSYVVVYVLGTNFAFEKKNVFILFENYQIELLFSMNLHCNQIYEFFNARCC